MLGFCIPSTVTGQPWLCYESQTNPMSCCQGCDSCVDGVCQSCSSEGCATCGPKTSLGAPYPGGGSGILWKVDNCNLCCEQPINVCHTTDDAHPCCPRTLNSAGDLYCCPESTPGSNVSACQQCLTPPP
jgi:hypothetical protein